MNKIALRSASILLATVLAFGIFVPGRATSQNAAQLSNKLVDLAFFYKPPSNSDAATVAGNFSTVILTGGDENFRGQLVSNGFSSTIPQYYRSDGIQDPGNCTSSPAGNQIAYKPGDFCEISTTHPDWFLLDTNGNRMRTSPTSNYYRMDPGSDGWRNFFVSRLLEIDQQKGWSGVFLDNLEASLSEIQSDGLMPAKYPDNASYQAAVKGFIQYLYINYSQAYNRPMLANIIARSDEASWFNYLQYLSGAMQERWAVAWSTTSYVSESKWLSDLSLAEKTQSQGKFIILVAPGDKADTNRQKFAFATYLLIANGNAAFRYTNSSFYNEVWLYDTYNVQLGLPLGARYQTGTTWRRDFANGYVVVDPINHTATIATTAATATNTAVPTSTQTSVPTVTNTFTPLPTFTQTATQIPTLTATNTAILVPTSTATNVPTTAATNTQPPLPTSTPASVTIYDEKNAAFAYSSGWTSVSDSQAYNGAYQLTKVKNSYVTFGFTGQSFTIIYKTGPLLGKMSIYVDGKLAGTLDQKASSPTYQKKWKYSGTLAAGPHTLKLIYIGPTNTGMSLDAVSVP